MIYEHNVRVLTNSSKLAAIVRVPAGSINLAYMYLVGRGYKRVTYPARPVHAAGTIVFYTICCYYIIIILPAGILLVL